mmetsp:Transcript_50711/g.152733  ORF Transcript_50711/g.152733 Transcript_50711/m.152733 type:complete len:525 (-) Transcript_50711:220-1794(-)
MVLRAGTPACTYGEGRDLDERVRSRESALEPTVRETTIGLSTVAFSLVLPIIVGLAAAFAVFRNHYDVVVNFGDESSRNPSSGAPSVVDVADAPGPSPSPAPSSSSSPTTQAARTRVHAPNPLPQTISPSYTILQTIEGYDNDHAGFSTSFSSDGAFMAVGSKGANGVVSSSGIAQVYRLNDSTWSNFGNLISGYASMDEFGSSLSISDDGWRLAVGARNNSDGGVSSGNVQIFQYYEQSNDWEQIGHTILGEPRNRAGFSVAISGDGNRIAVGAPRGGSDTGSVRIFGFDGKNWDPIGQELFGDGHQVLGGYSCSLSRDGNTVAMSVPRSNRQGLQKNGHVSIFRLFQMEGSPSWQKVGDDIIGEHSGDQNGMSVDLSADGMLVAIGANGFDYNGVNNVGYCRVFRNEGRSWVKLGTSIRGNLHDEQSGFSISLSGDGRWIACGGANSPLHGFRSGVVRVYRYIEDENNWIQIGGELSSDAGAAFGHSVSLSENGAYLAVGAPERSAHGLQNEGLLKVYGLFG